MEDYSILIEILEASVKKNGADKPVTIGHLLAIIKMAERNLEKEEDYLDKIDPYEDQW